MDLFQNPSSSFPLKSNRIQTAMWAARLVLMLMGVMSLLVFFKVAVIPYTFHLLLSTLPRLWASARSWLTLPFVYVIVNFIIITIAASSKKTTTFLGTDSTEPENQTINVPTKVHEEEQLQQQEQEKEKEVVQEEEKVEDKVKGFGLSFNKVEDFGLSFNKVITTDPSKKKCTNHYFLPDSYEKGHGDGGGDDDGDDTLDATWRAIMEGQGKTMKPQLKKSDTWSGGGGGGRARIAKAEPFHKKGRADGGADDHVAWAKRELTKSDTFNDRASLRREKSMSPEELNLRSEAFIKNMNHQMKLQRLESDQRFLEMVNRGA